MMSAIFFLQSNLKWDVCHVMNRSGLKILLSLKIFRMQTIRRSHTYLLCEKKYCFCVVGSENKPLHEIKSEV